MKELNRLAVLAGVSVEKADMVPPMVKLGRSAIDPNVDSSDLEEHKVEIEHSCKHCGNDDCKCGEKCGHSCKDKNGKKCKCESSLNVKDSEGECPVNKVTTARGISDDTYNKMTHSQQQKYIKEHPMSKWAVEQRKKLGIKPTFQDKLHQMIKRLPSDTAYAVKHYVRKLEAEMDAIKNNDLKLADKIHDRRTQYWMDRLSYDSIYDKDVKKVMDFVEKQYKDIV